MQIYIIRPSLKKIESFEISDGLEEIKKLIGFDSIGTDEIDNNRNMLYFD